MGLTLVMPFLPLYIRQLGVTDTADVALWAGTTFGITPAITALFAPLWGRVGDRFGNKVLVQRSLVGGVIVLFLMGRATQPWHLLLLRALQGLIAGYGPLTLAMAASSAPRPRMARAIATVQTAQRMGPAIGPVLGGILASIAGLRNVFFIAAAIYGVAAIIMAVMYVEPRESTETAPRDRLPFKQILAFHNFVPLMAVIFGLQLVDKSFGPVLLLHLDQLGYSTGDAAVLAGVMFSLLAVAAAAGNQLAATLLKRMTPRSVIDTAALAGAAALTLFALRPEAWLMLAAMTVVGLAIGAGMTTSFTAAGSVLPRRAHGAGFGFLGSASLTGFAMSPIVSGIIAGRSIRAVFFSGVGVLLVIALIVRRVMVERTPEMEPSPAQES